MLSRAVALKSALLVLAAAVAIPALPSPVQAQGAPGASYRTLPILDQFKDAKRRRLQKLEIFKILTGSTAFDTQADANLTGWYTGFVFRAMTQPEFRGQLATLRGDITDDLKNARQAAARNRLFGLVMSTASKIAGNPQFHPAVRVNCALLLGELNAQEASGRDRVPTPDPRTLPLLRELAVPPEGTTQPDGVRLAAMVGLLRHLEAQWAPGHTRVDGTEARRVFDGMLALAQQQEPSANRSPMAHQWLRARAIDLLAAINTPGPNGEVFQMLQGVIQEPEASLMLKCVAAEALGRLDYSQPLDGSPVVEPLARLLYAVCQDEVTRLERLLEREENNKARASGAALPGGAMGGEGGAEGAADPTAAMFSGGGPMMGGLMGGGFEEPERLKGYYVEGSRRRLRYRLMCIQQALAGPPKSTTRKGLTNMVKGDAVELATKVQGSLDTALQETLEEVKLDELMGKAEAVLRDFQYLVAEDPLAGAVGDPADPAGLPPAGPAGLPGAAPPGPPAAAPPGLPGAAPPAAGPPAAPPGPPAAGAPAAPPGPAAGN